MGFTSRRPPLWTRIWSVLFCGGVSAAIVAVNTQDYLDGRLPAGEYATVIPLVLILALVAYRLVRLSFRADASGLEMRDFFRTRRIPLAQIIGFDVGRRFVTSRNSVRVITPAGVFPIGAYGFWSLEQFFVEDLDQIATELNDWLQATRSGRL